MKEVSDQARVALAFALALLVMVGWYFLNPPKPQPPPGSAASQAQSATALAGGAGGAGAVVQPNQPVGANSTGVTASAAAAPVTATGEKDIVVESDLYRVELSNRGGVVRSWQLKKYTDGGNPPRVLDLVNADLARQTNSWPLSLQLADGQQESAANQGLYVVKASAATRRGEHGQHHRGSRADRIPLERWAAGRHQDAEVRSRLHHGGGNFGAAERASGELQHRLARRLWRRDGISRRGADAGVRRPRRQHQHDHQQEFGHAESAQLFRPRCRERLAPWGSRTFTLPPRSCRRRRPGQPIADTLTLSTRQTTHTLQADGKTQQEILPEMAVGSTTPGPLDVRLYVGPKDIDTLKAVRPPLNGLVQFGWFGFIAEPLFYILRWIYHYIPNYGWAIVVMTDRHQYGALSAEGEELAVHAEDAEGGAGNPPDSGPLQEIFHARSAQAGDEQGSDGGVQPRGREPHGELPAASDPDADLVWTLPHAERHHRIAARAVVRHISRSLGPGPLFHFDDYHGAR